ncbi:MAG TPA: hypothetical protein VK254_02095, partial [Candidatus Bathyarchaeia archaeon]|nr:hypothetical protein [Candidatus Bathyarchaeia archaeon]
MQKQKYIKMKLLDLKYIVSFAGMFFLIFVFSARSSHASTVTWTGNTSAVWSIGTNWDSGSAPLAGDDVVINGGNNQPTIDLSGGTTTINSLTIGSSVSSTLTFSNGDFSTKKMVVTGSVVVGANGRITHTANAGSQAHVVFLEIGGDLSIASGGAINVDAKGFASASGTGAGGNNGEATGGGYGGSGGIGWTASGGSAYGSITQPADIGSGGGNSGGTPGGAGGGAVKIVVSGTT